jgi:tripartite ATP-independent transporter DctM subunit
MDAILICFISFIVLCMIPGIPVAFSVGMCAVVYSLFTGYVPLNALTHRLTLATESWPIMAVPFFVLMGHVMNQGKSGRALMDLASSLVGSVWGGLSSVSIVTNMFFGGCSGSAVADASSIGSVLIPEMIRKGYGRGYSAALNAGASTIGIIIPPSIPLILFGWLTEVSIRDLFWGGLFPGIAVGLMMVVIAALIGYRRNYPKTPRPNLMTIIKQFAKGFPAFLTLILVMGGILAGVYTTTEAAIIGAVYVTFLELFFYRGLNLRQLWKIVIEAAKLTGVVIFLISTSFMLTYVIVINQLPELVAEYLFPIIPNGTIFLLATTAILLFTGCFLDLAPSLIIFTPILYSVGLKFGVNAVQLGVVVTMALGVGLFTPPVGQTLYISALIAKTPMEDVSRDVFWFVVAIVLVILAVIFFPALATWHMAA